MKKRRATTACGEMKNAVYWSRRHLEAYVVPGGSFLELTVDYATNAEARKTYQTQHFLPTPTNGLKT